MPLMWLRIATEGTPPERYTIQVPFQLGPTHTLKAKEDNELKFGNHDVVIVENEGIHLLRVTDFESQEQAEAYFQHLRGSLLRLTIKQKLSLRSVSSLQTVQLQEPPIEVDEKSTFAGLVEEKGWTHIDGFVDPTPAVVLPEHLRIVEFGTGTLGVQIGMPVRSFLEDIVEGLALPQPGKIAEDERLSLAIDLYASTLRETSQRARVVSFVTSLEALITSERVNNAASELLDRLLEIFDSERNQYAEDDDAMRELGRMRSRLGNLKTESISESLRNLVEEHATAIGETSEEAQRNITSAYGIRSLLVHEGYAPEDEIEDAAAWLSVAVPAILETITEKVSRGQ